MTFISKHPDRVDQSSGLTKCSGAKFSLSKRGQGRRISVDSMHTPGTSLKATKGHGLQQ